MPKACKGLNGCWIAILNTFLDSFTSFRQMYQSSYSSTNSKFFQDGLSLYFFRKRILHYRTNYNFFFLEIESKVKFRTLSDRTQTPTCIGRIAFMSLWTLLSLANLPQLIPQQICWYFVYFPSSLLVKRNQSLTTLVLRLPTIVSLWQAPSWVEIINASLLLRVFFCAETMCFRPQSRKKSYSGVTKLRKSRDRRILQLRRIPGGIGFETKKLLFVISTIRFPFSRSI